MTNRLRLALGALLSSLAAAASAAGPIIAYDRICPVPEARGERRFLPAELMNAALDAKGPSRRALDLNNDGGETVLEKIDAVFFDPCGERCKGDSSKIVATQLLLLGTFDRSDLRISRRRPAPTADEIKAEPWLGVRAAPGAVGSLAELLDPQQRYLDVTCIPPTEVSPKPDVAGSPGSLRVTSKLEELTTSRDDDGLMSVDLATISIANDNVDDKLTFGIDGIVGFYIPLDKEGSSLTPFVQYQRTSVRDRSVTPAETERSVEKLGLGATLELWASSIDPIDVAPIYVVDYVTDSRVISAKANWIPGFLRRIDSVPIGRARPLLADVFYWRLLPRVLVQGSHVLDAGTNAELLETNDYLRLGGDVSLDIWGVTPFLRDFTVTASAKKLWMLTDGPRDVWLFKSSLQYWVSGSQHVSVAFVYERGWDEDTIARIDDWKLTLGARF